MKSEFRAILLIMLCTVCSFSINLQAQELSNGQSLMELVSEVQKNSTQMQNSIKMAHYTGSSKFHIYVGWNAMGLNFLPLNEEYYFNGFWMQPDSNRLEIIAIRKATPDTNANVQVKIEQGFPTPNPFRFSYDASVLGTDRPDSDRNPALFSRWHISEPYNLTRKIRTPVDSVSAFLNSMFPDSTLEMMLGYGDFEQPSDSLKRVMRRKLQRSIARNFNRIIKEDIIYNPDRFQKIKLSKGTKKYMKLEPAEQDTIWLNRMLLEDTYGDFIHEFDRDPKEDVQKWPLFPFAEGADSIYTYEFLSEVGFDIRKIIEIGVRPKDANYPAVIGKFQIDPVEKIVVGSDVIFNEAAHFVQKEFDQESDVWFLKPFMSIDEDHRVKTRKALVFSQYWLPEVVEEEFYAKIMGIKVKLARTVHFTSYDINPAEPPDTTIIADKPLSYDIDEEFDQEVFKDWVASDQINPDFERKLIAQAEQTIAEIDLDADLFDSGSIFKDAMRKKLGDDGNKILSFGQRMLENVAYNRVEGFSVMYGAAFADIVGNRNAVSFKSGYGFHNEKWKGEGAFVQFLDRKKRFFLEGNLFSTVSFNEDTRVIGDTKNTLASFFGHTDYRDYYYRKGFNLGIGYRVSKNIALKVTGINQTEESAFNNTDFSILRWDRPFRINPGVMEGEFRGISASAKYWTGNLTLDLYGEHTGGSTMHSDFDFSLARADLKYSHTFDKLNSIYLDISAATSDGSLPPQRWLDFGGKTVFNYKGQLRGVNYKEFTGDHMAFGVFEYQRYLKDLFDFKGDNIGGRFDGFKRIAKLHFWGGVGWSELSDQNVQYAAGIVTPVRAAEETYYEYGIGIGDRFNAFRLDFIHNSLNDNALKISFTIFH